RAFHVTGVQTCALPISRHGAGQVRPPTPRRLLLRARDPVPWGADPARLPGGTSTGPGRSPARVAPYPPGAGGPAGGTTLSLRPRSEERRVGQGGGARVG